MDIISDFCGVFLVEKLAIIACVCIQINWQDAHFFPGGLIFASLLCFDVCRVEFGQELEKVK